VTSTNPEALLDLSVKSGALLPIGSAMVFYSLKFCVKFLEYVSPGKNHQP